jgi:hypothetical protein
MRDLKRAIFMVLPLLLVPLVYGLSSTPDVCALPREPGFSGSMDCTTKWIRENPPKFKLTCCWNEPVIFTKMCQTCTNDDKNGDGDTADKGEEDCGARYPARLIAEGQNLPTLEQVPPTPRNVPQVITPQITEAPPTPLPPPPTGPLVTPEDDENVADENGDEEDETRPPLRDNLPELQEEPEDEQPEQDEEPSNEGGSRDTGPIT